MLKAKCYLFLFFFVLAFHSHAQDYQADLFLGANFSQVDGDQFGGYNKLGLNVGIAINRQVKGPWEASFELLYSQKGSKKVLDPDIPEPSLVLNYHYVEIPLMARYVFNEQIKFYAGPSIGINVFNERDDNGFVSEEEALTPLEIALQLGGSYYIGENLALDLRHGYSIVSVRDYPIVFNGPTWFGRAGWYNRWFTVGVRYSLGK